MSQLVAAPILPSPNSKSDVPKLCFRRLVNFRLKSTTKQSGNCHNSTSNHKNLKRQPVVLRESMSPTADFLAIHNVHEAAVAILDGVSVRKRQITARTETRAER
ncbi:MAG: hypothetical protein CMJ80_01830 [Planctomycetaceae bacterium]|nr:hypothetical protein [Planctomycetaceae bacterium]